MLKCFIFLVKNQKFVTIMVKGDSFAKLNSDEKLERLFNEVRSGNGQANKNHKDLSDKFDLLAERVVDVENKVKNIDIKYNLMEAKVKQLTVKIVDLQQKSLECNIIIRNIPEIEQSEDDLCAIVHLLIQKLALNIMPNISCVRRIGKKGDTQITHRPILLQVTHKDEKIKLLTAKKKIKITCDQLLYQDKSVGTINDIIYFDEHLTKDVAQLYFTARTLRKRQLIKYVFIRNGTLFVKRSEKSPIVKITDLEELKIFEKRPLNSTEYDESSNDEQVMDVSSIIEHDKKKACTETANDEPGGVKTRSTKNKKKK